MPFSYLLPSTVSTDVRLHVHVKRDPLHILRTTLLLRTSARRSERRVDSLSLELSDSLLRGQKTAMANKLLPPGLSIWGVHPSCGNVFSYKYFKAQLASRGIAELSSNGPLVACEVIVL